MQRQPARPVYKRHQHLLYLPARVWIYILVRLHYTACAVHAEARATLGIHTCMHAPVSLLKTYSQYVPSGIPEEEMSRVSLVVEGSLEPGWEKHQLSHMR